ncbi:MAG: arsenite-activated ATPase ArsA [Nitrospirae bacterium]|nr:MAG: arsenite-activated ATPase ArsA [Nitrospirota bacterium]
MSLASLDAEKKRVLMFGGKGGVGKSTSSSATALHYALSGERTLLISSDFTPSLSDIFETPVGATETSISGVPNLWAIEIGLDEVMRRWKEKFGPQIYQVASAVVDMPYDDLIDYVGMAPGIQEEFMLDFILEYVRSGRYEMVVWDTAPAGDTLRLLNLPSRFLRHLRTAPRFYFKAQDMLGVSKLPFLDLINQWSDLSEEIMRFFTDPAQVEFVVVTIPEALGVYQSRRVIQELAQHGLKVRRIVVNGVIETSDSEFLNCRKNMQHPYIQMLQNEFGPAALTKMPLLSGEVKGLKMLREVEAVLFRPC